MNTNKQEFKSKLIVSNIRLLIPNFDKTFYLNIIINEIKTFKTKNLEFKRTNNIEINQLFELEDINNIEVIRFQLYEKSSVYSNALFKGEVQKSNRIKDEYSNQLMCYLSNNNQENCVVVYYNYELNPDLLDTFDKNLKLIEEEQKSKIVTPKSSLGNFMEIARGENAENFSKFVHNMEYIKSIENSLIDYINWKNQWKTLAITLLITYAILHWKAVFIIFPLIIIFFHIINRGTLDKYSHRNTKHDHLANMKKISESISLINQIIDFYENIVDAMQNSDKKAYEEIYVNLIKLIGILFFIFYFELLNVQLILILSIWSLILWRSPTFKAFALFFLNFIHKKFFINIQNHPGMIDSSRTIQKVFYTVVPFANIIRKFYKIRKEMKVSSKNKLNSNKETRLKDLFDKIKDNNVNTIIRSNEFINPTSTVSLSNDKHNQEMIKFDIYENERWWMFVGWAKNLIMNERPLWSDISGKNHMDKNSVFLPNDDYVWVGDWKVELTDDCDDQGWQYSSDFNSVFGKKSVGKYVRRRKWVRYATENK